ncbi:DNA translocase FtsK [Helicobacter sp. 11S03491-1]|uniref:FtsK/SpoIIIE family DNA translocase n=1 Tax=Helicobacter sp. 11S03491-1 TaxID=1476196 RepID=UPI000BA792C0|nr:DNA translocase FtsK [Helicobacter sp. 11S03491-1]PAF41883.1 hypothetical protein BKH45_06125 [Helicobacter sp. 11S03491-1]
MKQLYLFVIFSAILIFFSIATIFGNSGLVGKFGIFFAQININFFGYFAYFYLLLLIYPIYRVYVNPKFNQRRIELILGGILGFVALLILQAMVSEKGLIGQAILEFLYPFIGYFGIFVLALMMIFISYVIFFPKNFTKFLNICKDYCGRLREYIKDLWKDFQSPKIKVFPSISNEEIFDPQVCVPKDPEIKDPEIKFEFDENNIKVTYSIMEDQIENEKKYANMVRLVGEDEEGEVREGNIERVLNRNKQFFEELSLKHFSDYANNSVIKTKNSSFFCDALKDTSSQIQISKLDSQNNIIKQQDKMDLNCNFDFATQVQPYNQESLEKQKTNPDEDKSFFNIKNMINKEEKEENIDGINEKTQEPISFVKFLKQKNLIVKELSENTQLLQELEYGELEKPKDYKLPSTDLLEMPKIQSMQIDENEIDQKIQDLLIKLRMFKIDGDIARTYSGPIVTTFEFRPAPNVKVSRILTLEDDLAMALRAQSIRIQAPIPGKDVVGIEIPNAKTETIYLREILESDVFKNSASPLTLALGKDIVGNPFVTDLKKLPHILIAGTTGSGKSVGVNAMILSLLFRNSPDNLKLIMIDPKMVEFSMYSDIPHLLTPIITNPKKAIAALGSAVNEMERRYQIMSQTRTKNIDKYNPKAKQEGLEVFPFLVIIIDELADLMMTGGKEAEFPIARIAQMGRAAGLHLIVATQRPSVDVVTGLIKTNLPSRISFKVGSKVDSRVVLDTEGAQSLLGRGDMLFTPPGIGGVVRLHAPWASEEEIEEIVKFIKSQREVAYDKNFLIDEPDLLIPSTPIEGGELIDEAKRIILQDKKTSISYIQRKLGVGYNKAASIIEELEKQGFLSPPNTKGLREIVGR